MTAEKSRMLEPALALGNLDSLNQKLLSDFPALEGIMQRAFLRFEGRYSVAGTAMLATQREMSVELPDEVIAVLEEFMRENDLSIELLSDFALCVVGEYRTWVYDDLRSQVRTVLAS